MVKKERTTMQLHYRRDDPIIVLWFRGTRVYVCMCVCVWTGSKERLHGEERRQDRQWGSARSRTVRSCDGRRAGHGLRSPRDQRDIRLRSY